MDKRIEQSANAGGPEITPKEILTVVALIFLLVFAIAVRDTFGGDASPK